MDLVRRSRMALVIALLTLLGAASTAHGAGPVSSEKAPNGTVLRMWGGSLAIPRVGQSVVFSFSAAIVHGSGPVIFQLIGSGGWKVVSVSKPDPSCGDFQPSLQPNGPQRWVIRGGDCTFTTNVQVVPTRPGKHSLTVYAYATSLVHNTPHWPAQYRFKRIALQWSGDIKR